VSCASARSGTFTSILFFADFLRRELCALPAYPCELVGARRSFEYDRRFWDIIFAKANRPILWEVFRQLDDRTTRYYPLYLKVFPDLATRPRQREVLIEYYRKGKADEALRAFKRFTWRLFIRSLIILRPGSLPPRVAEFATRIDAPIVSSPSHPALRKNPGTCRKWAYYCYALTVLRCRIGFLIGS
jgi:hypothetical protein